MTARPLARGDIVLTKFPFTDLTGSSLRPALVVSPGLIGNDLVLAGISSVVRGAHISTDLIVVETHAEFPMTGLRIASAFRMHKLAAVERYGIVRFLGKIGPLLQAEADRLLRIALGL